MERPSSNNVLLCIVARGQAKCALLKGLRHELLDVDNLSSHFSHDPLQMRIPVVERVQIGLVFLVVHLRQHAMSLGSNAVLLLACHAWLNGFHLWQFVLGVGPTLAVDRGGFLAGSSVQCRLLLGKHCVNLLLKRGVVVVVAVEGGHVRICNKIVKSSQIRSKLARTISRVVKQPRRRIKVERQRLLIAAVREGESSLARLAEKRCG